MPKSLILGLLVFISISAQAQKVDLMEQNIMRGLTEERMNSPCLKNGF